MLCCLFSGLPKMQAIRNYTGMPAPALHEGPPLHIQAGDTVELLRGDAHSLFWQVLSTLQFFRFNGWFITTWRIKLSLENDCMLSSFRNFTWCEEKYFLLTTLKFTHAKVAMSVRKLKKIVSVLWIRITIYIKNSYFDRTFFPKVGPWVSSNSHGFHMLALHFRGTTLLACQWPFLAIFHLCLPTVIPEAITGTMGIIYEIHKMWKVSEYIDVCWWWNLIQLACFGSRVLLTEVNMV